MIDTTVKKQESLIHASTQDNDAVVTNSTNGFQTADGNGVSAQIISDRSNLKDVSVKDSNLSDLNNRHEYLSAQADASSSLRQRHVRSATAPSKEGGDIEEPMLLDATNGDNNNRQSETNGKQKGDNEQEEEKNEKEEDILEEGLPPSIFSLLFIAEARSKAHLYATLIFGVEIVILFAALLDNLDLEASNNPANFPLGVPLEVTVAQAAVIPLAVASQNDFINALLRLNDRAFEQVTFDFRKTLVPDTTLIKWLVSSMAQLIVGMLILIVIFLFIMQSYSVFQVLVNFVALFAIANIPNVAFNMALHGFVGYAVFQDAVKVTKYKVKRSFKSNWALQIFYLCSISAMFLGYAIVVHRQLSGYYLCKSVFFQFDDEFHPDLPLLSGVYDITNEKFSHRFKFVDEVTKHSWLMAYCGSENSFTIADNSGGDPCSYMTLSQETDSFDVTTSDHLPWRVLSRRDESLVDTASFLLQCSDCDTGSCPPRRGTCVNNKCQCLNGRYGHNCQFRAPCEEIVLNARLGNFPPITSIVNGDYIVLPDKYILLRDVNGTLAQSYHRPVYYSDGFEFLLLFMGRRWAIVSPREFVEGREEGFNPQTDEEYRQTLVSVLRSQHPYNVLTSPLLQRFTVSAEVETGSTLDSGLPIGLRWLSVGVVRSASRPAVTINRHEVYDSMFICAFCEDDVNDCDNLATCNNISKTCECRNSTFGFPSHKGALCEKPVTCQDVRRDNREILPTGCFGDFRCRSDGRCDCDEQFPDAGSFCQFLPCSHRVSKERFPGGCANDGICNNVTGNCLCNSDYFQGMYCQDRVAGCNEPSASRLFPPSGCANDGVCINATGFCDCLSDAFAGRYCQTERPRCDSRLMQDIYPGGCANNGTCVDSTCICSHEIFSGVYCEVTNVPCNDQLVKEKYSNGCANDGFCNATSGACECLSAFDGRYCQVHAARNTSTIPVNNPEDDL